MATTTTHLGLTKPATGDANWGATMNANLDLIDSITTTFAISPSGGTFNDASAVVNLGTGTTNGLVIGTLATHKLGFHGQTPTALPASAAQAAIGSLAVQTLTDSTSGSPGTTLPVLTNLGTLVDSSGGTPGTTIAAISDGPTKNAVASLVAQLAVQSAFNYNVINCLSTLCNQINNARTDLSTIKVLANQIRSDLIAKGLIKGSA